VPDDTEAHQQATEPTQGEQEWEYYVVMQGLSGGCLSRLLGSLPLMLALPIFLLYEQYQTPQSVALIPTVGPFLPRYTPELLGIAANALLISGLILELLAFRSGDKFLTYFELWDEERDFFLQVNADISKIIDEKPRRA